jgi:hypothetical protein
LNAISRFATAFLTVASTLGCTDSSEPGGKSFAQASVNSERFLDREITLVADPGSATNGEFPAGATLTITAVFKDDRAGDGSTSGVVELRKAVDGSETVVSSVSFSTEQRGDKKWQFEASLELPRDTDEYLLVIHLIGEDLLFDRRHIVVGM